MEKYFYIFIPIVIIVNGLWYLVKYTLKQNGYYINWFFNHGHDIPNMIKLAKETEEPSKRKKYFLLAYGLPASLIITFGSFIIIILLRIYKIIP